MPTPSTVTDSVATFENMRSVELALDAAMLTELDQASVFDARHPFSMLDFAI